MLQHLAALRKKYGLDETALPPGLVVSGQRARRAAAELESTIHHVRGCRSRRAQSCLPRLAATARARDCRSTPQVVNVERLQRAEYVLLRRESLSLVSRWGVEANMPAGAPARTSSPILANAPGLRLEYFLGACPEVRARPRREMRGAVRGGDGATLAQHRRVRRPAL